MQMRIDLVLLLSVWCAGCASSFEKPVAQAPAPQQAAVAASPAPVADAASPKFECSDGTISFSQTGCLVNMARERLPPSQQNDPASTGSVNTGHSATTSAR
jgi:hypothetical protein